MRTIYWPIYTLRPFERGIQETLGKYTRFILPGLGFQIPFVHILRIRDVREHTMDIHPQPVITKDNVEIQVDPTRETLFTVVPREEKYQAKNVIDTVVHRGADMTGTGIVSVFHTWGMTLSHMAFVALPIAGLWLAIGIWLGRRHEAIRRR
jgi:hypothetical protein